MLGGGRVKGCEGAGLVAGVVVGIAVEVVAEWVLVVEIPVNRWVGEGREGPQSLASHHLEWS